MTEENKDLRKQRREKILLEKKQAANSLRCFVPRDVTASGNMEPKW